MCFMCIYTNHPNNHFQLSTTETTLFFLFIFLLLTTVSTQDLTFPSPSPYLLHRNLRGSTQQRSMATCGSLRPLFENPITAENPTLIETLSSSWSQIKPVSPVEQSSFTEIFGELHFREKSSLQESSSTTEKKKSTVARDVNSKQQCSSIDSLLGGYKAVNQWSGSSLDSLLGVPSSIKNSTESLQLCTEGLGIESSDDVEDSRCDGGEEEGEIENNKGEAKNSKKNGYSKNLSDLRFPRNASGCGGGGGAHFPPPISCIGRSGKPWIAFKSIKEEGRFVLKEIKIPTKEFLHALREDGKLRLYLVQPDDTIGSNDDDEYEGNEDGVEAQEEEEEEENENCDRSSDC